MKSKKTHRPFKTTQCLTAKNVSKYILKNDFTILRSYTIKLPVTLEILNELLRF